jgi:hypothetical protein
MKQWGGVLFIDEAYSLSRESGHTDYGEESIEIILQSMDNQRGKFSVIVAGYTNKMIEFLTSNPGFEITLRQYY